jgi:hypothetical protein
VTKGSKRPPTQVLRPRYVVESDEEKEALQRARDREKAADRRRAQGRLPDAARTIIDKHPDEKASTLATWLQANPRTKKLIGVTLPNGKPMLVTSLAKKISRYRRQK